MHAKPNESSCHRREPACCGAAQCKQRPSVLDTGQLVHQCAAAWQQSAKACLAAFARTPRAAATQQANTGAWLAQGPTGQHPEGGGHNRPATAWRQQQLLRPPRHITPAKNSLSKMPLLCSVVTGCSRVRRACRAIASTACQAPKGAVHAPAQEEDLLDAPHQCPARNRRPLEALQQMVGIRWQAILQPTGQGRLELACCLTGARTERPLQQQHSLGRLDQPATSAMATRQSPFLQGSKASA
jgi:hypothetical protein